MPLVIKKKKADAQFWDNIWQDLYNRSEYDKPLDIILLKHFKKYLPKEGKLLEGGCGLGRWVYYLHKLGYRIEGVDYAEKIVEKLNRNFPYLNINKGNILSLKVKEDHYSGYLSLGVLEHFDKGPDKALKEAKRVLAPDGILFITVPYFNPLRVLKFFLGYYKDNQTGEFYQYLYTKKEFQRILKKHNFRIIKISYFGSYKGIKDELFKKYSQKVYNKLKPGKEKQKSKNKLFYFIKNFMNFYLFRYLFGHAMIIICSNNK